MRPLNKLFRLVILFVVWPAFAFANSITSFTLDNGMDVVVIEDHRAPVVTHMVWYKVGAADEPWGQSGIAHFFEHLMFKGTEAIPPGQFSKIIAQNGGQDNAFTSQDYTAYFQRIAKDRLDMVMRMEADRMQNLTLADDDIKTERQVVLEERNQRVENQPSALLGEQIDAAFYRNHPYGVPIIGWPDEISGITKDNLLTFYQQYYAPDQAILIVTGDVTLDDVRTLAQKHYAPLKPSGAQRAPRPTEPAQKQTVRQKITMVDERVGQPYIVQRYHVPSTAQDIKAAASLTLLAQLLDGGATGQLYADLDDTGIALDSGAYYRGIAKDSTQFTIYGVPSPSTTLQTLQDAIEESLLTFKVIPEDLERAKQVILNELIYQRDSQRSLANTYGSALSVGLSVEDVQSWPVIIESITAQDIEQAAQTYLTPETSTTGWLLKADDTP